MKNSAASLQLVSEIESEAESIFEIQAIEHAAVLEEILDHLEECDFREIAGLDPKEKIAQKHLIVSCVREILKTAHTLSCGICIHNENLYVFNGQYWRKLDEAEFHGFLSEAARRLGVDDVTAEYHRFSDDMFKQFMKTAYLPKPEAKNGTTKINLRNGTFEVDRNRLEIREFRRQDFLTYQLPFEYDPSAKAPLWLKFLSEVLPDASKQMILAEYIGYIFAPQLKLEKALILFGYGQNGKSVVFDCVNALLGHENVSNFSLEALSHEYYRAMIGDKLLNYSSEISNRLEAQKFKQLTSGEPVEARQPYGKPFILRDYARLAFNTNDLPRDVEHTDAFFRRFLILEFDVKVPDSRKNPNLAKQIIAEELSGIFNWVLDGLKRLLQQNGFSKSQAADAALADYRKESDSVAMFIEEENYKPGTNEEILFKSFYSGYRNSCFENGLKPLGKPNFRKRLEHLGFLVAEGAGNKLFVFID